MVAETGTLGVVVIGRNEGARLLRCLASLQGVPGQVVYVDSGSTDGSVAAAHAAGAQVVELDMTRPFTAARARNAGLRVLGLDEAGAMPDRTPPDFIQFVDGDCEMDPGWLATAMAFLRDTPRAGVVAGRLRERHPEASPYNALCDREWDTPLGETEACGGIAMMRSAALAQTRLFNPGLIAGEEPDLCLRLRRKGWQVWRIADEMALHDAAMLHFSQFWKRMRRGGFAFASWAATHGSGPERMGRAQRRRALVWGLALPLVILLGLVALGPVALGLLALYPAQIVRLARREGGDRTAWQTAALLTVGKFPEALGVLEYHWRKIFKRPARLIEHKSQG